jgi:hypothetical protein
MLRQSSDEIRWWTFAGGAANLLLARMLGSELGDKVSSRDTCITLKEDAAKSLIAVQDSLRSIAERQGPTLDDARRHANGGNAKARSRSSTCACRKRNWRRFWWRGYWTSRGRSVPWKRRWVGQKCNAQPQTSRAARRLAGGPSFLPTDRRSSWTAANRTRAGWAFRMLMFLSSRPHNRW